MPGIEYCTTRRSQSNLTGPVYRNFLLTNLTSFKPLDAYLDKQLHHITQNRQPNLGSGREIRGDLGKRFQHVVSTLPNRPMGKYLMCVGH